MPKNDAPTTVVCPLEHVTVDAERCAACGSRSSGHATCTGSDRIAISDLNFLIRAL